MQVAQDHVLGNFGQSSAQGRQGHVQRLQPLEQETFTATPPPGRACRLVHRSPVCGSWLTETQSSASGFTARPSRPLWAPPQHIEGIVQWSRKQRPSLSSCVATGQGLSKLGESFLLCASIRSSVKWTPQSVHRGLSALGGWHDNYILTPASPKSPRGAKHHKCNQVT